jgi:MFS family permease
MNLKPKTVVFYGWWIVGSCFLIAMFTSGIVGWGFTAIIEPVVQELGCSYAQISVAASLRGLEVGLLAPVTGMLADRWGARRLIFGGLVMVAAGYLLLSRATSLATFYGAFALVALGFSACSATVLITAVSKWFRKRASLAVGIVNSGWGFSGLVVPLVVGLIYLYQWRTTMVILALAVLLIGLPLSMLVRHRPERYGYLPDGEKVERTASEGVLDSVQVTEINVKAKQALRTPTFWHISVSLLFHGMIVSATATHVMPYLSSIGFSRETSALAASAMPLLSVIGRLGFGWLGDRANRVKIAAAAFIMVCLGMLCFSSASCAGAWMLIPFLILFSIGVGGNNTMRASLVIEFFGRESFGTLFGFVVGIMMIGFIVGPPLAGWTFDKWGAYQGIWMVFAGLSIVASIIVVTTPNIDTSRNSEKGSQPS